METPLGTATPDLTHVVFTRDFLSQIHLYIDGVEVATDDRGGLFTTWADSILAVANEPSEDRAWLGELYLVAVYDRALEVAEVSANFQAGPGTDPPAPVAPTIIANPSDTAVIAGQSATFSVVASGSASLSFQWERDSVPMSGENSASLVLPAVTLADDGASFRCVVSNIAGSATSAAAILSVDPLPVNDPPIASDDGYGVDEGAVLVVDDASGVLQNDSDPDGDPLEAVLISDVVNGVLALAPDGSFTYQHDGSETLVDSFVYEARDNIIGTAQATVTIAIAPINDIPLALDDEYASAPGALLQATVLESVLLNDSDGEGEVLDAVLESDVSHGVLALAADGSFTYQHDDDGSSSDSFTYLADDGSDFSAPATVTISIGSRVTAGLQALYDFSTGTGSTVFDRSGIAPALDLTINDPTAVAWLGDGGLSVDSPTALVSAGPATRLGTALSATQAISIEAWVLPVEGLAQFGPARIVAYSENGYPAGGNFVLGQTYDSGSDTAGYAARLRTTATNKYGTPELASAYGTATATLTHLVYTRDAAGATRFYIDGVQVAAGTRGGTFASWKDSALALANEPVGGRAWLGELHLIAIFDRVLDPVEVDTNYLAGPGTAPVTSVAPTIDTNPANEAVLEGQSATFSVVASGTALLTFQWERDGAPITGATSASLVLPAVTLADDGASFRCVVTNIAGTVTSAAATLTVDPLPINDPPTANDDSYAVDEGDLIVVDVASGVLQNDSDPDGDPLEAVLISDVANGILALAFDGSFSYQHDGSETLVDSFVYEARDNIIGTAQATVTIAIAPVNDIPLALDDEYATAPGALLQATVVEGVLLNDSDGEGTPLDAVLQSDVSHGVLALAADGSFTYQHDDDGSSSDSFTYLADDGTDFSAPATVTISIGSRVTAGLQALYDFSTGTGSTVFDRSGVAPALDLTVNDPTAVAWLGGGGLSVDSPTELVTAGPATRLGTALSATQAITIEAWVLPVEGLAQFGPARIVAYSENGYPAGGNFILGQTYDSGSDTAGYAARLRTTATNKYGTPELASAFGTATATLTHLVYTRDAAGATRLYIDGVQVAAGTRGGTFASWKDSALALANEPVGGRAWLGELHLIAIFDRVLDPVEVDTNFLAGPGSAAAAP